MNVLSLVEHFVVDLLQLSLALLVFEAAGSSAPGFTVYQVSRLTKIQYKKLFHFSIHENCVASLAFFQHYNSMMSSSSSCHHHDEPQSTLHTDLSHPKGRAGIPEFCRQLPLALLPLNLLAPCASVCCGRRAALSPLVRTAQRPACLSRGISSSLAQFRLSSNPSSQ